MKMRLIAIARARLRAEEGFTITELMVSLAILSIAFFALAGVASTGLRIVAEARQREAATEIANGRLEHLRDIPYDNVALNSGLCSPTCPVAHSTDTNNPDYKVSADGTQFTVAAGKNESLIEDSSTGEVPHIESPVAVGPILYSVYQYVTWVDDPVGGSAQDYKRLTVVAFFNTPVNTGRPRQVAVSALFTPGSVTIAGDTADATVGSSPTPTPTPSPTPSGGSCSSDTAAPTGNFSILSGAGAVSGYTASTSVTLKPAPVDSCTPITLNFSNDGSTYGGDITYDSTNPSVTWTVTGGADGTRSIYAKFRDALGNSATFGPKSIILDTTKPTKPGTLTRTVACTGGNRTVTLNWGVSTDTYFLGYRTYKSTNGGAWTAITTTSTTYTSDTDKKSLDSVSYYVVGYDKAGNESPASNIISLSKNKCS